MKKLMYSTKMKITERLDKLSAQYDSEEQDYTYTTAAAKSYALLSIVLCVCMLSGALLVNSLVRIFTNHK